MPEPAPAFPVWQRGLRRLRLIFDTWYPWDQKKVAVKVRPLKFRRLEVADLEWCGKLYERNERCGLPESGRPHYAEYLTAKDHLVLIAEDKSGRVGTFGIHLSDRTTGYISYLLVDPGAHRSGVGTTLLLAAIALLGVDQREKHLLLTAFDSAAGFYRNMAFNRIHSEKYEHRLLHHLVLGPLLPLLIEDCRQLLTDAGVDIGELRFSIPFSKVPAPPMMEEPKDIFY